MRILSGAHRAPQIKLAVLMAGLLNTTATAALAAPAEGGSGGGVEVHADPSLTAAPADSADRAGSPAPNAPHTAQPTSVKELTVVGRIRQGAAYSDLVKQNAPNSVTVRTLEEMQKLPDINIGDALSRMSGISAENNTGEARYVNIRGMDADLNSTTFGGVRLMPSNQHTPFGGSRAVAMSAIPTNLVAAVEVTKTNRPDQDAEALGGTIEFVPREVAPNTKPFIEADIGGGYEPLHGTPIAQGQIVVGGSFGLGGAGGWISNDKPFSLIAMASEFNDQRGLEDAEQSYADTAGLPNKLLTQIQWRRYNYSRHRYSRGGEFAFDPNPDNHFFIRFIESGYHEHTINHKVTFNNLDSGASGCGVYANCLAGTPSAGFIAPAATTLQGLRLAQETVQNDVLTIGANQRFGEVQLDYHVGWSRGIDDFPYDHSFSFNSPNSIALAYNNIAHPGIPTLALLNGNSWSNPSQYNFAGANYVSSTAADTEYSAGFNLKAPLNVFNTPGTFKFGALVRLRKRDVSQVSQNWSATGNVPLTNYTTGADQIYYDNHYNQGPAISGAVANLIGASAVTRDPVADAQADLAASSQGKENVYAGYGQYEGTFFTKLHVLAGLRIEATEGTYSGYTSTTDVNGVTTLTPSVTKQNYVNFFPDVEFRYEFTPSLIGRLGYSTGIARPGFQQITPATTISYGAQVITQGNAKLKPTTGDNFDASLEYYMHNGGKLTFAAFDKEFQNYIVPLQSLGPYNGQVWQFQSFGSVNHAQAYGFEADYAQKFIFLPGILQYLGTEVNYTWIDSSIRLQDQSVGGNAVTWRKQMSPLPSSSRNNANATFYYDDNRFSVRVAMNYLSQLLYAYGANSALDTYTAPQFHVDLGTSYRINDHWQIYLDAKNLTNEPLKYQEGAVGNRIIQREFYYQTIFGGVRMKF